MATFVMVHGAFQGGWVWQPVASLLREQRHTVFTPTLSGAGERVHLLNQNTDLSTYVEDVANHIFFEDLHEVVLVGHSYAGMIITAVAGKLASRISHLVYLDAVVPEAGKSFLDIAGREFVLFFERHVTGWQVRPWPLAAFGIDTETAGRWFGAKLVQFPLKAFKSAFPPYGPNGVASRTYIRCTGNNHPFLARMAEQSKSRGWDYREIASGHSPMVTAPDEVAALLDRIAASHHRLHRITA